MNQWQSPEYSGVASGQTGAEVFPRNDDSQWQEPAAAIPIVPIKPGRLNIRIDTPASATQENAGLVGVPCDVSDSLNQKPPGAPSPSFVGGSGSISEVAAEAVRASRALAQAANQSGTLPTQPGWDAAGAGGEDLSQTRRDAVSPRLMGYGSLETSVEDNKIAQAASEFSDNASRAESQLKRVKVNQVPFVG